MRRGVLAAVLILAALPVLVVAAHALTRTFALAYSCDPSLGQYDPDECLRSNLWSIALLATLLLALALVLAGVVVGIKALRSAVASGSKPSLTTPPPTNGTRRTQR